MKQVHFINKDEWRSWLEANHAIENEVWLVFKRKKTGLPAIPYEDAVEQALCFGWIDSLIKKLGENQYARKFTPRKLNSKWSALNIRRLEKMINSGLMTKHGLRLVEAAKQSGNWDKPIHKPLLEFKIQPEFIEALQQNPQAEETFNKLSPTYQKQYITWIEVAKRADTKKNRIEESIQLLAKGLTLGLK